ncbi:MAG: hypothetical protein HYU69_07295 [Bacteroidetes bacterium]|nr:hypothetical protein [Bacteroidota bacterium]
MLAIQNQTSTCGGTTGKATALVQPFPPAPSTGPYTYGWSNGQTTVAATGLSAGAYKVTVTNASGCTSTAVAIIGNSNGPNLSVTNNCSSSKVTAFGGTLPYTYLWSNGQTTQTATNIKAGDYVIVTDASGCYNIIAPVLNPITVTVTSTAASCGGNNGSTAAGASGINSWPYAYLWNNAQTTQIATNLAAGTYTVTVTGSNGCTQTETVTLTSDNCEGPTITATGNSACPGTCVTVTSNGAGGTSPYTYSWSNGATSQNIGVCPVSNTTYTVKVTDSGGSTATSMAVVTINPAVSVSTNTINITCNGGNNGNSIASPGSGTSPFTFNWSNGQITQTATGLSAGNYTITITDSKGCTATASAAVISPPALTGQFTKGTANCAGCGCKEWIHVNGVGGTNPYSYLWPDGYVNRYKNQLCPGTYTINIKDKNGCSINVNLTAP